MSLRINKVVSSRIDTTSQSSTQQEQNANIKAQKAAKVTLGLLKDTVSAVIISFAVLKSPAFWLGIDEASKHFNLAASPIVTSDNLSLTQRGLSENRG